MISTFLYRLKQLSRRLWIRAALISVLAVVVLYLAPLANRVLPRNFLDRIDVGAVQSLVDILANSMLAVTTFSLTVMVTAHFSASSQATPRAHRILRSDTRTQTVLATFIGAFVYALVSEVFLQTGILREESLAAAYVVTLLVLALVIVAILRWIEHLSRLGSMEETTRRVEEAARAAIRRRNAHPYLGGHPLRHPGQIPEDAHSVAAPRSGFVQLVDSDRLNTLAQKRGGAVYLAAGPGDWVRAGAPIASVSGPGLDDEEERAFTDAITLGDTRTFVQDAEFGLTVLAEIAQRALSPGLNDPRTAADVIARIVTLLLDMTPEAAPDAPEAPHVYALPLPVSPLLMNSLDPIARDGAAMVEVQMHIQAALGHLAQHRHPEVAEAARIVSRRAMAYAEAGLQLEEDIARTRALAPVPNAAPAARAGAGPAI
ncbi:DUF2254 domain-containing protein [Rhodobacteraceae bacterium CCMM004]|nr:DUF2254 domain-containing protein [Rhodobacteraceae bacterium CCMM004]